MTDTVTLTFRAGKGLAEMAQALRVAAAVTSPDAKVNLPLSPDEARMLARAFERMDRFPAEAAEFEARADAKIDEMRRENRRGWVIAGLYPVSACVFLAVGVLA